MKAIACLLSAALLAGAGPQDVEEYGRREAESRELEDFRGGFTGAWIIVLFGVVMGGLIIEALSECDACRRTTTEELPPWEGPARSREAPSP